MAMNSSKTLFDSAMGGDRRALAKLLTIAEEGGARVRTTKNPPGSSVSPDRPAQENQLSLTDWPQIGRRRGKASQYWLLTPHHPFQVERFSEIGREWYSRTPPRYTSDQFPREAVLEESPTEFAEW